jgi:succinoglycan biosynthesis transport protein ExoP
MNQEFPSTLDPAATAAQGPDLLYYWQLFKGAARKYYIGIIALSILCTVLAAMFVQTLQPSYIASVRLHVKPRADNVFNLSEVFFEWRDPAFQETQIAIMTSQKVLTDAVRELGLHEIKQIDENSQTDEGLLKSLTSWFGTMLGSSQSKKPASPLESLSEQDRIDGIAARIRGQISIQPVGESYLLQLSVTDTDANRTTDIANQVADSYVKSIHDSDVQASLESQAWLMDRMTSLREDLRASEQRLQEFREQEDILGSSQSQGSQVELDRISTVLLTVRENRMSLENQNNQIRQIQQSGSNDYTRIAAVASHPIVQSITREVFELERKKNELGKRYGPKHNKMIAIESELASARKALQTQSRAVVETIRNDYSIAQENEKSLVKSLEQARQGQQSLGRKEFQLRELEAEVSSKREIYDVVLMRFNQTNAASSIQNTNIRVADYAIVPRAPNSSRQQYLIYAAFIASLMAGLGLAMLAEALDSSINTPADVEHKLGVETIGTLPEIEALKNDPNTHVAYDYYHKNHHSIYSESVRTIRTSLILDALDSPTKRMMVTSSVPGEGKTSVALNIAAAFGESEKVLLIDADLRRPSLDRALGLRPHEHAGLTDLIAGAADLEECLIHSKDGQIDILTAGKFSRRPLDIFSSEKFGRLLSLLDEKYDRIIMDTAPVSPVSDALLLSPQVDSLLFVIKAGRTAIPQARRSLQKLYRISAPINGVVLNKIDETSPYYEYEYYSHGYGSTHHS